MLWKVQAGQFKTGDETWYVIARSAEEATKKIHQKMMRGKEYYAGWKIVHVELIATSNIVR